MHPSGRDSCQPYGNLRKLSLSQKINLRRAIIKYLRPISLTAILSKHLERILGGWMLYIITDRLDTNQYGVLKGLPITHALLTNCTICCPNQKYLVTPSASLQIYHFRKPN